MELSKDELKLIIKEAIQEALLSYKLEKVTLTIKECVNYTGIGRDKIMELAMEKMIFLLSGLERNF